MFHKFSQYASRGTWFANPSRKYALAANLKTHEQYKPLFYIILLALFFTKTIQTNHVGNM
jgi:hypothetical protein